MTGEPSLVPMTRRSSSSRNIMSRRVFDGDEEGLTCSREMYGGSILGLPPRK